jgi:cytochrome P450/NADPH-cytochrome P450 reductase
MSILTNVLVEKWESFAPNHVFSPWDEFSQLALDIISQSAFDLPLNALRNDEIPQFAHAITDFFSESGKRAVRPSFITKYVFWKGNRHYWKCIQDFQSYSRQVINKRRGSAKKKPDVLNAMLEDVDQVTGKKMSDQNCVYNTLSLLGAGWSLRRPGSKLLTKFKATKLSLACLAGS